MVTARQGDSPAIEVEGLTKVYPNGYTAVTDLSLRVPRGIFGLLGPNGAGKTTTIGMLVGALRPTRGTARILGLDIGRDSIAVRHLIGYLPEHPPFYDEMPALRFLTFMGELDGMSTRAAITRAGELLHWLGLGDRGKAPIHTFSAGMKQRLGLAQALIGDPKVIFLDEPTSNLDPMGRADLIRRVQELACEGRTVVVSSHIIPEMEQMVDHVAIMAQGKVMVAGSVAQLTQPADTVLYRVGVATPDALAQELCQLQGVSQVSREDGYLAVGTSNPAELSDAVVAFCHAHRQRLTLFEPQRSSLLEVFERALQGGEA